MIEEIKKSDSDKEIGYAVQKEAVVFGKLRHREVLALLNNNEGPKEGTREGAHEFKYHCANNVDYH